MKRKIKNKKTVVTAVLATVTLISSLAIANNVIDVPGPPGTPYAVHVTNHSCTIKFTEPATDGGSPILYYQPEYREEWTVRWKRGKAFDYVDDFYVTGKVDNLPQGAKVKFRAFAINKVGSSMPSGDSEFITIKER